MGPTSGATAWMAPAKQGGSKRTKAAGSANSPTGREAPRRRGITAAGAIAGSSQSVMYLSCICHVVES